MEEVKDLQPILELDTLPPRRPTIRLRTPEERDGQLYELRTIDDIGIEEQQQLHAEGRELDKLWNAESYLNSAERKRLKVLLDHMFDRMLDAPAEIKERLSDGMRSQVVLAFTLAPLTQQAAREQGEKAGSV